MLIRYFALPSGLQSSQTLQLRPLKWMVFADDFSATHHPKLDFGAISKWRITFDIKEDEDIEFLESSGGLPASRTDICYGQICMLTPYTVR